MIKTLKSRQEEHSKESSYLSSSKYTLRYEYKVEVVKVYFSSTKKKYKIKLYTLTIQRDNFKKITSFMNEISRDYFQRRTSGLWNWKIAKKIAKLLNY